MVFPSRNHLILCSRWDLIPILDSRNGIRLLVL